MLNGAEPVCDDDGRAFGYQILYSMLNDLFGLYIHTAGGFIQDQYGRIIDQGTDE